MGTIIVEAACHTDVELEEEVMLKIQEFDQNRRVSRECLPLTDYEKLLLREFLRSLLT